MRNFQDTFETCKRSSIGAFSICMTVPLSFLRIYYQKLVKLLLKYSSFQRQKPELLTGNILMQKIEPRKV